MWQTTLSNPQNASYTCTFQEIADSDTLKRLVITAGTKTVFVATVEKKPEGHYLKEIELKGQRLEFRKENGMLLPSARKTNDTWQLRSEKKKLALRIRLDIRVTVDSESSQRLDLSVKIHINAKVALKKINENLTAVVTLNPSADYQILRVQLPNGEIYDKQT